MQNKTKYTYNLNKIVNSNTIDFMINDISNDVRNLKYEYRIDNDANQLHYLGIKIKSIQILNSPSFYYLDYLLSLSFNKENFTFLGNSITFMDFKDYIFIGTLGNNYNNLNFDTELLFYSNGREPYMEQKFSLRVHYFDGISVNLLPENQVILICFEINDYF